MNLIIETDLGHDCDDFFAICYLIAAGVNVRAITIVPGDPDQIAIAKLIIKECGLDIPVGASKLEGRKPSSGSIHHELLHKYKMPLDAKPDGLGKDIIEEVFNKYPDSEFFVIGPVSNFGSWLKEKPLFDHPVRVTMQGGFLPYSLNPHTIPIIENFVGKDWIPTFNLNGDRKSAQVMLDRPDLTRSFVGKHVCHTVLMTREIAQKFQSEGSRASELFCEGLELYFEKHTEKKFHDPTAAVCHLHPEIAQWVTGQVVKYEGGWTTRIGGVDNVIASIDYKKLFDCLMDFN